VELSREFLAVRAGWLELGETQPSVDAAFAEEIQQMREQSHVLPVANFRPHIAVGERVFNESRREGVRLSRCRFEEGRLKRQHFAAIGRRAFWKEHDERAAVQQTTHFAGYAGYIRPFVAPEEERASQRREPAKHRPAFDFALGHEDARRGRAEYQDVQIAEVIADE